MKVSRRRKTRVISTSTTGRRKLNILHHIQPRKKINESVSQSKILNLCSLPVPILESIVKNINLWHRNRVRDSCKKLRYICDSVTLHDFKSELFKYEKLNPHGKEYATLKIINLATWVYIRTGCSPSFLGNTTIIAQSRYKNTFTCVVGNIIKYLLNFYKIMEKKVSDPPYSHRNRILYLITLLGFFKESPNSILVKTEDVTSMNWKFTYQLEKSWLGMLWSADSSQNFGYKNDRYKLLILLSETAIAAQTEISFKKVWHAKDKIFVYGYEAVKRKRQPYIRFTYNICGSPEIISFFKNCSEKQELKELPTDEFCASITIECQEAIKWGGRPKYDLQIGPYDDCIMDVDL